ncbi:MAG TPA: SEC-C metal-binding domain-containing protein [Planctomycetota bacterium]|nr:SEC-C metal-binding domain-containing protein [Planctomycetota bacterium]
MTSAFPEAEEWATEFSGSTVFSLLPDPVKEGAPAVCAEFLRQAREATEVEIRRLMLEIMPSLELPAPLRQEVPEILAVFLSWLEDSGRLAEGRALGTWIGALGPRYLERCSPRGGLRIPPIVKKTKDLGRNDPCPCGSGRKFKKCCAT